MCSAAPVRPAAALGLGRYIVLRPFSLPWIADRIRATVERCGVLRRDRLNRLDEIELAAIRLALVQVERLIAHRHPLAALQRVAVVVDHFAPGAFVNDRLIALQAQALLAFEGSAG